MSLTIDDIANARRTAAADSTRELPHDALEMTDSAAHQSWTATSQKPAH